jgi:hypothetical protein
MGIYSKTMKAKPLYSLIPLEDFKTLLGVDDREDKLSRFCLVTATFAIEQFCKRRLLRKTHTDYHSFSGDHIFTLREYPLRKIHSVHAAKERSSSQWDIIEPGLYFSLPDAGICEDLPFSVVLRPPLSHSKNRMMFQVRYSAGYVVNSHPCEFTTRSFCHTKTSAKARKTAASMPQAPPDLASACLELAAWNLARYRGRRIGMTGSIRGSGRDGGILSYPCRCRCRNCWSLTEGK